MQVFQKIYIIGAGAIGKTLAVFLKRAGRDVVLLRGHIHDVRDYTEEISVRLKNGELISEKMLIRTIQQYKRLDGIVVLASKSYGNAALAERLKDKVAGSPLVLLQNGLHIELPFIQQWFTRIYRCVLFTTCQFVSENLLQFKPVSVSPVGIIKGDEPELAAVVAALNNDNFLFRAEPVIGPVVWKKAIINSVFNSVCPLLETDNGIFYRDASARVIARTVIDECIGVAALQGVLLDAKGCMESLLQISKYSEGQLISTYQDIIGGRPTEIDTLNMAIAAMADQADGKPVVIATRLLGEMIRIKSGVSVTSLLKDGKTGISS